MAIAFPGGGTLTVRVRGVPFPIEFADWTKGDLVEQVEKIIRKFTSELVAVIRAEVVGGVTALFESRTPPRAVSVPAAPVIKHPPVKPLAAKPKTAKANGAPIQLCPVPKCTGRAAPSLGMVCAKHKNVPKAQIKKYREARRAAKAKKS